MKNILLIITILVYLSSSAQLRSDSDTVRGKLIRNVDFEKICNKNMYADGAIVQQYQLTEPEDIKKYGNNLYFAVTCGDYFGDGWFDGKTYKLVINEVPFYTRKRTILNPELFELNIGRKVYWMHEFLGIKTITINCGSMKRE